MSHLSLYRNENSATRKFAPLLLDLQSNLLDRLETRVVVPLYLQKRGQPKPITRLTPVVAVDGKKYVVMTPQLAGVPAKMLKKSVGSLAASRAEIIAALDLLFTGF